MHTRRLLFVLFPGMQSLDLSGPMEVFTGANEWRRGRGTEPVYDLRTASLGGAPVSTSSGLRIIPDGDLATETTPSILVVPGGHGTRTPDPALIDWLREHGGRAELLVSVCTGAFLLAAAGLLNGRQATTHWSACRELARRYPDVTVLTEPIFVRDGDLATSAGVTAGIDLALALVEEELGREVALSVARYLVMFLRRPGNQAQFSAQLSTQVATRQPLRELQQWIAEHPEADLSVDALAARVNLSPRQFARTFAAEIGMNPGRYVDRIRLEAARRGLEDAETGIQEIARRTGYGTPEAMRRAFLRALGVSPAEYRRRFTPATQLK